MRAGSDKSDAQGNAGGALVPEVTPFSTAH